MVQYLVSLDTNLTDDQYQAAIKHIKDSGAKIVDDSNGRGKLSPTVLVEYPEDSVSTLEKGPGIFAVEKEGTVTTR